MITTYDITIINIEIRYDSCVLLETPYYYMTYDEFIEDSPYDDINAFHYKFI